jgi:hypothetical protein
MFLRFQLKGAHAMTHNQTPGEIAYNEDVRRRPAYDKGAPRPAWATLETYAKQSWERQPTPREWNAPALT